MVIPGVGIVTIGDGLALQVEEREEGWPAGGLRLYEWICLRSDIAPLTQGIFVAQPSLVAAYDCDSFLFGVGMNMGFVLLSQKACKQGCLRHGFASHFRMIR